jgi:hypothetical protein
MIKATKISPCDLKIIVKTDRFRIEEVGNSDTGEIHREMFINTLMTVDEIIYAVKKYDVEITWYQVGTDRTHTFPLIMKTIRECVGSGERFDPDNAQSMLPVVHKMFWDDKEWRYIYDHSI